MERNYELELTAVGEKKIDVLGVIATLMSSPLSEAQASFDSQEKHIWQGPESFISNLAQTFEAVGASVEVRELPPDIMDVAAETEVLSGTVEDISQKLDDLQSSSDSRISDLTKRVGEAERKITTNSTDVAAAGNELDMLRDQTRKSQTDLELNIATLTQEKNALKKSVDDSVEDIKSVGKDVEAVSGRVTELEDRVKRLRGLSWALVFGLILVIVAFSVVSYSISRRLPTTEQVSIEKAEKQPEKSVREDISDKQLVEPDAKIEKEADTKDKGTKLPEWYTPRYTPKETE